ncbi:hypothetical protein AXG93_4697s1020 [Marchantia polymorpha subsp. ruderalis]|uniref:Uncharacterized protein n=1 Tax=Marchantia polymorpha subsp. ruderalis TaxID=1480154 RepID=A0A176VRG5_MARPO|nr:hypothetical protein AXG93_4697s1020 [Marchantia polymorpha subsp. ruderalis]
MGLHPHASVAHGIRSELESAAAGGVVVVVAAVDPAPTPDSVAAAYCRLVWKALYPPPLLLLLLLLGDAQQHLQLCSHIFLVVMNEIIPNEPEPNLHAPQPLLLLLPQASSTV